MARAQRMSAGASERELRAAMPEVSVSSNDQICNSWLIAASFAFYCFCGGALFFIELANGPLPLAGRTGGPSRTNVESNFSRHGESVKSGISSSVGEA